MLPTFSDGPIVVARSDNQKTGPIAATYAARETCPIECSFRVDPETGELGACYGNSGRVRIHWDRIPAMRPDVAARREAKLIDELPADRPLRVHVVGDCRTDAAARILAAAMVRYDTRSTGGPAYTYTHAWRTVARASWGAARVLASCESSADIQAAHRRGYETVVTVADHPTDGRTRNGLIPCPEQTREGIQCVSCRLCFEPQRLAGRSISFAAHGTKAALVKRIVT
jgi:hypothetical protein